MITVAALYVERGGPYFELPGVDPWDEARDARLYAGPHPVVAHPPCGPWGMLRHLYRGAEHDLAPLAVAQVRRWGGVLEHPAWSRLWLASRLPRPGELPDEHGGFSVSVTQVSWGHVALKPTWLYFVGVDRVAVERSVRTGGRPTHWIGGSRRGRERSRSKGERGRGSIPDGIMSCSKEQRRRTPVAFAWWLVGHARTARPALAALALDEVAAEVSR